MTSSTCTNTLSTCTIPPPAYEELEQLTASIASTNCRVPMEG